MSPVRYAGVEGHIGRTPLLRLRRLSEMTGCEILGKAEFMNPGGSIKDRAALGIIEEAEARGVLHPGGTIVEGTAGNTGIGLTVVGLAKGYRTVIVIPDTQSVEKISLLRTLGAQVITVPEKPYSDPGNYNRQAERLAQENGWYWANQFDNLANRLAHYQTTGPEIWEQTSGEVTGFVASIGTGGTLAGCFDVSQATKSEGQSRLRRIPMEPPCIPGLRTGIWRPRMAIPSPRASVKCASPKT
jgi:cysteine synthase A